MPRMPIGPGPQQSISGQTSGPRIDPRSQVAGQGLQAAGKLARTFGSELEKMEDKWQKAESANQYTTSRNERKVGIAGLMEAVKNEGDHTRSAFYADELKRITTDNQVEFSDQGIKDIYDAETKLDRDMAEIKIRAHFRGKMINHTRGQISGDTNSAREDYLNETNSLIRHRGLEDYKDRQKGYQSTGVISNLEYVGALEDTKDWELDRAMQAAGNDPESVLDSRNLANQFKLTPGEKTKVQSAARATVIRNNQIRELASLKNHAVNMGSVNELLGDDDVSLIEKTKIINDLERMGKIPEKFAVKARRAVTDIGKMNTLDSGPIVDKIVKMYMDINVEFEGGKGSKFGFEGKKKMHGESAEYLMNVQAINMEIATSSLPPEVRRKLTARFNMTTQKKIAMATAGIGAGEKVKISDDDPEGKDKRILREARRHFEGSNIPKHLQGQAMRSFFYKSGEAMFGVDGKMIELDNTQSMRLVNDISQSLMTNHREETQKIFDDIRTGLKARAKGTTKDTSDDMQWLNADLRITRTEKPDKNGVYHHSIIRYVGNKRVENMKDLD